MKYSNDSKLFVFSSLQIKNTFSPIKMVENNNPPIPIEEQQVELVLPEGFERYTMEEFIRMINRGEIIQRENEERGEMN